MGLNFEMSDLLRWASFSGDENPIHFNPEAAAALGLNEVVVHGMLAMLPLKILSSKGDGEETTTWSKWSASLRRPYPISVGAEIKVEEKENKTSFRLVEAISSDVIIKGTFIRDSDLPIVSEMEREIVRVDEDLVWQKLALFNRSYPDVEKFWVFLDALVFFLYVKRNSQSVFAAEVREYLAEINIEGRSDTSVPPLVMHATHTIAISPELLSRPLTEDDVPEVGYSVRGKDMVKYASNLYGVVEITIFLNGIPSMVVDLGLIAKFSFSEESLKS